MAQLSTCLHLRTAADRDEWSTDSESGTLKTPIDVSAFASDDRKSCSARLK